MSMQDSLLVAVQVMVGGLCTWSFLELLGSQLRNHPRVPCPHLSSTAQKNSLLVNAWCMRPGNRDLCVCVCVCVCEKLCKRQSRPFVILVAAPNGRSKTSGCKNKRLGKILF